MKGLAFIFMHYSNVNLFYYRFVRVELLKEQLLENNKQTYWVPDFVKVHSVFLNTSWIYY